MASRILNGVMGALFAFAAVLQYNDPDPVRWMVLYLAASIVCGAAALRGSAPVWAAAGLGLAALIWAAALFRRVPGLDTYLYMFDHWEMKSAAVEEAREASGLLIVAVWMGILAGRTWFSRKRQM